MLESKLKTDVMLVAGSLASHLHTVRTMAAHMNKTKSTLVLIDGIGDVLNEAVSLYVIEPPRPVNNSFYYYYSRINLCTVWSSSFRVSES